jgi:hypothetical protein
MDIYRSILVTARLRGGSDRFIATIKEHLAGKTDSLQSVFDQGLFCSQIHCLAVKM